VPVEAGLLPANFVTPITIDRLESGGVAATLTTPQRFASALGLEVNVELKPMA
jgi:hypothetical protein